MAKERKASVIYEGNGTQQTFSFPFDYLRKAFVKAEIIDSDITELEQGKDYSITDKELTLNSGVSVATGKLLKIYRETTTDPLVEWQDASVLRSADLSLQEVQLLHLAEETADKVFDSGMSTAPTNTNVWDGQYKRITNLLDPQEDGDAVTLRYVNDKQHGLIAALKNEGANQNASIVSTGDSQNTRLTTTGNAQNTRLITTGDTQNSRLTNTGDNYVATMTTLKDTATTQATNASNSATSASSSASTATTKANEAKNSATSASSSASTATTKATEASNNAELAKKWAMSDSSPDGVSGNKSSKTWANEAKNSATSASSSASTATTKANEASNSASAAAKSAENAKTWDPSSYYNKTEVDNKISTANAVEVISATVNHNYAYYVTAIKSGHIVQVRFYISKTQGDVGGADSPVIASGLPPSVADTIFTVPIPTSSGTALRFIITTAGELREQWSISYTTSAGHECESTVTYICQ